jgi:hypothetical protein
VSLDGLAQAFPVEVQRLADDRIQVFLVGVDWQNAFRVGGFVEPRARALLFRQLLSSGRVNVRVRVTLAVFRQPVGEVDHADTQGTTPIAPRLAAGIG